MAANDNIEAIINAAQEALDQAQASLTQSEDFLRHQGIDPQKMRTYLDGELTEQQRAEAHASYRADLEAIEQEVAQAKLHQSFQPSTSRSTGLKPSRNMI